MEQSSYRRHVPLTGQRPMPSDAPSRRKVLRCGAFAFLGANLELGLPWISRAYATDPHIHSFKVGAAEVIVISDGKFDFSQSFVLPDRKPREVDALFLENGLNKPNFDAEVNVVIIRIGDRLVLVDAGGGSEFLPTLGRLSDRLQSDIIAAEQVTDVIFTHAHPDHFWGVIDPFDGMPRFPNARLYMTTREKDYWLSSGVQNRVPPFQSGIAIGTQRRLNAIKDQVDKLPLEREIIPGLLIVDTAGHTPGHISLHLSSEGEQLFIGGDVLIHPIVSFSEPKWHWGADTDWSMAVGARVRVLDMLATDKIKLLGYHLPWPGVGRVKRSGIAYQLLLLV